MLEKGEYKTKGIISISKPLSTLKETQAHVGDVFKCVLEKDGINKVVYLIGGVDFGSNSVLSLKTQKNDVLIYPDEYVVLKRVEQTKSSKLVDNLLTNQTAIKKNNEL